MGEYLTPNSDEVRATPQVYELFAWVLACNEGSLNALAELSIIANSCPRAAQLIERIDQAIEDNKYSLPSSQSAEKAGHDGLVTALSTTFGGVPIEAWSKKDQQKLARGEKPKYYPEHPNV